MRRLEFGASLLIRAVTAVAQGVIARHLLQPFSVAFDLFALSAHCTRSPLAYLSAFASLAAQTASASTRQVTRTSGRSIIEARQGAPLLTDHEFSARKAGKCKQELGGSSDPLAIVTWTS